MEQHMQRRQMPRHCLGGRWSKALAVIICLVQVIDCLSADHCEPKVLDEQPPDPWNDISYLTIESAKEFAVFLATKITSNASEILIKAKEISNEALQQDPQLLAFGIAAPSIQVAGIRFRDEVENQPNITNHNYLKTYWRELGVAWNNTDGTQFWGVPFRDCGPLRNRWLWPFSVTVLDSGYKIVATAFIAADNNLCNDALEEVFGKKHSCDRNTTFCFPQYEAENSSQGGYMCLCKMGYFLPNLTIQGFSSDKVELGDGDFTCLPCPPDCMNCDKFGQCTLEEDNQDVVSLEILLRATIGGILGACVLFCVVVSMIVFRQRKCKTIATGMWTVLETIILGILFMYAAVGLHFMPASTLRCLLEPWCRELGFIVCYGAIILKLYRHLVEFRTRKAHRWVLRDVDLLKYLGSMTFAVICYLAAFTASSLDLIENAEFDGLREAGTNTCHPLKWEFVTQTSEIVILGFGLHLSIASRNANTQFRERQFLVASILIEFLVSSSFYILRAIYLPELSPGAIFLALFVRSQLTNTVTLLLVFLPKLWYQHKQVRYLAHDLSRRLPVDAFKGSHDVSRHGGGYAGILLGDPDIGEVTISEMSPEEIRAELKRLYTQLEILKNKTLRQGNPHISKRRGGRKVAHRRFSLQKKGSKDKALSAKHKPNRHPHDMEVTEAEASRTPEDSVCSVEGPTDTYD